MAVDLPQPLPPQQATVEALRGEAANLGDYAYDRYQIHIAGDVPLDAAALRTAIQSADTISNAVRAIANLAFTGGAVTARVDYALAGDDLFVRVTAAPLQSLEAEAPIARYFDGLPIGEPLTAAALERRRALASVHADRARLDVASQLSTDGEGVGLHLKQSPAEHTGASLRLGLGNPGNRFVGRYFFDIGAGYTTRWGDSFQALARGDLSGLNRSDSGGDDYNDRSLDWSRVTPLGLFGLQGRHVAYTLIAPTSTGPLPLSGKFVQATASWFYPLYADFSSRWTVQLETHYTDKTTRQTDTRQLLQNEEYGDAALKTGYAYAWRYGEGRRLDADAALTYAQGFGDDQQPLTNADLGYSLLRPAANLHFAHGPYSEALQLSAQATGDAVPEQQQWVLGGSEKLAAWLPGVAIGDRGLFVRAAAEWQALDGKTFTLAPQVFAEYGESRGGNTSQSARLADAGIGLTATAGPVQLSAVAAEPIYDAGISRAVLDLTEARFYFSLTLAVP